MFLPSNCLEVAAINPQSLRVGGSIWHFTQILYKKFENFRKLCLWLLLLEALLFSLDETKNVQNNFVVLVAMLLIITKF